MSLIQGPIVKPSPFAVSEEKLKSLSVSTRNEIGRLFLALDLHNENGFTKIQLVCLVDTMGYNIMHEAVSKMWYDMLLLSEEEEEEERNVIPDNEMIIRALSALRDADEATADWETARDEYNVACEAAKDSWWLLGLGSRNEKLAVARNKAEILERAKLRSEELKQRVEDVKMSSSPYHGDDIVSLDEFLILIAELASQESEESTLSRFCKMIGTIESELGITLTGTESAPTSPPSSQQVKPAVVPPPQQHVLEEVELSEKAVIEHELNTVLEKRRKFFRDMGEKPKSEWSIAEMGKLSTYDNIESEFREELKQDLQ